MKSMSALLGKAALAIWNDVPADEVSEFNEWYTHEHLPERVGIPGFLRGRRFISQDMQTGTQKYFTMYETEHLETLSSAPYLERLNQPTEWTQKMGHLFKGSTRSACQVTASYGQGIAGNVATLEFGPTDNRAESLRNWLVGKALVELVKHPEIVSCHLLEANDQVTNAKSQTAENVSLDGPGSTARWIVVAEATHASGLDATQRILCGEDGLRQHGASQDTLLERWNMMISLTTNVS